MRTFIRFLFAIATVGFFFIGIFLIQDAEVIAEHTTWFGDTKFNAAPALFLGIYIISLLFLTVGGWYFIIDEPHWKTKKELTDAITRNNKEYEVYREAKNDLAIAAFDFSQRTKELQRKINELKPKKDESSTSKKID